MHARVLCGALTVLDDPLDLGAVPVIAGHQQPELGQLRVTPLLLAVLQGVWADEATPLLLADGMLSGILILSVEAHGGITMRRN